LAPATVREFATFKDSVVGGAGGRFPGSPEADFARLARLDATIAASFAK
jgi:hypothetical protein